MSTTKLNQSVRVGATGEITTIAKLLDEGRVKLNKVEHFGRTGRTAYFADFEEQNGVSSGWEISKTAYESRMGIKPDFSRKPLSKEVNEYKGYRVRITQYPDGEWALSASKKHGLGGFHRTGPDRDRLVKDAIEFLSSPFA